MVHVEPVDSRKPARWSGQTRLLGADLCESIREVLTSTTEDTEWTQRARKQLVATRQDNAFLEATGSTLAPEADFLRLWTFAGGRANGVLAKTLEEVLGSKVTHDNLALSFRQLVGQSEVAVRQALEKLAVEGRPNREDALRFAGSLARG